MQNIKAIINNHNMKFSSKVQFQKQEVYCPLTGKCLLPNIVCQGKINATQCNYNPEVYFGVVEKLFKDSTTTSNPLSMKITKMTKNCQKNTGKLKETSLFQK